MGRVMYPEERATYSVWKKGTNAEQNPADVFSKQPLQTDILTSSSAQVLNSVFFSLSGRILSGVPGKRGCGDALLRGESP